MLNSCPSHINVMLQVTGFVSYLVDDADGVPDVDLLISLPQFTLPVHRLPQQQLTQVVLVKLLPPELRQRTCQTLRSSGVAMMTRQRNSLVSPVVISLQSCNVLHRSQDVVESLEVSEKG